MIDKRPKRRRLLVSFALMFLLLSGIGFYQVWQHNPREWAPILSAHNDGATPRERLLAALQTVTTQEGIRPGAILPLVKFRRPVGASVTISILETDFANAQPGSGSQPIIRAKRAMLVNSVDENQSISGGVSGKIGVGCGLEQSSGSLFDQSNVAFHDCHGPFQTQYGVKWVANVGVVVYANPDSEKRPCWNADGNTTASKYEKCLTDDVTKSLGSLFQLARVHRDPDVMILPALGTGVGGLEKDDFYTAFFAVLMRELNSSAQLPTTIYLQIYSKEPASAWLKTKNSIATILEGDIVDWNNLDHVVNGDWASLTGVAGCLSILLLLVSAIESFPFLPTDMTRFAENPSAILILGWFSASFGLSVASKSVLAFLPDQWNPWLQIGTGAAIVILCGPLLRVGKVFDDFAKPKTP
jgi:hypothetical protein